MDATQAIVAEGVTKSYSLGKITTPVLRGVSFSIPTRSLVALVGPSGSGKSTLLNLLGGLDRPTSGSLTVFDEPLGSLKETPMARYRQHTVGMVFQSFNLLPHMTALENVVLAALVAGEEPAPARVRATEFFNRIGLEGRLHHRPTELSGGEQQRIAILRALMNRPRLLLADEPTGNLDSATGKEVLRLLTDLAREQQMTLLIVTHDPVIAASADLVLHLHDGQLKSAEKREGAP